MAGSARARLAPVFWLVAGGLCCAAVSGFEPNLLEEGIGLHVASRLANGERLYRDVLVFTGPLPFELLALLFRGFGEEILVARSAVVGLHALASAAAFALARAARPGWLAHAAAAAVATAPILLFPLFHIYYYTTIAFHLSVLSAWAALRGTRSARWAFVAGVLVAGVALSKQTLGLAVALALGLALLFASRPPLRGRALLGFAAGGAATAALTLSLWLAAGTLGDAVHGLVSLPSALDDSYELPFIDLWPLGALSPATAESQTFYLPYFYILTQGIFVEPSRRAILVTQLLFALPLLAAAATLARGVLRGLPPALVLHGALLVAWLANLVPRTDWGHLSHVLPLAVAQLCLLLPGGALASPRRRSVERGLAALVLASLVAGSGLALAAIERIADPEPLGERVPLRPVSQVLRGGHLRSVIAFLERNAAPGEAIFVARAEPLLYFATNTRNPTPYPGIFPALREQQERSILTALERVRFVVMSDVDQPAMTWYRDELPAVQAQLERAFRPAAPFRDGMPWLIVLERGPDRGATAIDLVAEVEHGRPFTNGRGSEREPAPALTKRLATRQNRKPLGFSLGPDGGGIDFEIDVPARAVFQADVSSGVVRSSDAAFVTPPGARIVVSVGPEKALLPVAEAELPRHLSQRWIPLEADLSAWAGQRVWLRIELIGKSPRGPAGLRPIGYVGSPRITTRNTAETERGP